MIKKAPTPLLKINTRQLSGALHRFASRSLNVFDEGKRSGIYSLPTRSQVAVFHKVCRGQCVSRLRGVATNSLLGLQRHPVQRFWTFYFATREFLKASIK